MWSLDRSPIWESPLYISNKIDFFKKLFRLGGVFFLDLHIPELPIQTAVLNGFGNMGCIEVF